MKLVKLLLVIGCMNIILPVQALVRLPQLIGNGMVLQRDKPVIIWGWADTGESVSIVFKQHRYAAATEVNGMWKAILPAMAAGGPYIMQIRGNNQIDLSDIMIGDVWLCSGQSNMALLIERVKEKYAAEINTADYPQIRNFFVSAESDISHQHADLKPGKWVKTDRQTILGFGATSWFFALQLYKKYHVPIGIINSSVGGTPIEAWISEAGFKGIEPASSRLKDFKKPGFIDSLLSKQSIQKSIFDTTFLAADIGARGNTPWFNTAFKPENWHHFWLPGYWADQGIAGLNGVVWFRKEIIVPASMSSRAGKLLLGRIVDADQTYLNGKLIGSTSYQYPPRRYEVPPGLLLAGKNILVIRVINTGGKGGFVADKPYHLTVDQDTLDLRGDWQYKVGQVFEPVTYIPSFSAQNEPAGLYNTMIAPLINYGLKGFVWYQGESNTSNAASYGKLLKLLITDWRYKWKLGNIPFIYAQLPGFNEVNYLPVESAFATLREGQLQALSLPGTGMAVTIDAGEWNDIHPLNKKTVGDRLAQAAMAVLSSEKSVFTNGAGPLYKSARLSGSQIEISFTNTGNGICSTGGSELAYFSIAGADKKFIRAQARIADNKVLVWSTALVNPVYVRYAWADNPESANLANKNGLPASPFRTDTP